MREKRSMDVIVDLQFGSCGKGLLAGYIAKKNKPDCIVMAWAPNAGHTFIDAEGNKMVSCAIPNGIVSDGVDNILMGPGSVINPELLMSEMEQFIGDKLFPRVHIHEHAAIVTEGHRALEAQGTIGIGSTMKGVGEAYREKLLRITGGNSNVAKDMLKGTPLEACIVTGEEYADILDSAHHVQVEGAQGYSLGINSGFYPYTTSRECTVAQLMVDCAIPKGYFDMNVIGAARTFPIRVANRYDAEGNMIGWSGPHYYDQEETSFEQLSLDTEYTTVTKLPRRIFTFSHEQIRQACRMNGVNEIFLNFCNYLPASHVAELISEIETNTGVKVGYTGWGPKETDIIDCYEGISGGLL
jgi:adenylosuccinate synthase